MGLPDLTEAQIFRIHEPTEVIIVGQDKNAIFPEFKIVSPCFEDFNNSPKLTVMSFVSNLGRYYFPTKISYSVALDKIILGEN